jgi:DNA-binding CsgD family transcriptional regulator/tetratricopeptide (TPR) repeat protein
MALTRGGLPAAAVFLERSAALTPDTGRRAQRSLAAAEAKFRAGAFDDARRLLEDAAASPCPPLAQARTGLLRAQLMFAARRGNEALPLLIEAARRLEGLNTELARDAYLDVFCASIFAGRLAGSLRLPDVAHAAREAPRPDRHRKGDLLLDGVTAYFTGSASPTLGQALAAYRTEQVSLDEGLRSLWLATVLAVELWDVDGWADLCARYLSIARESGALSELPLALNSCLHVHLLLGDASAAAMLADEARAVNEAVTEGRLAPYGAVSLAAWQGRAEAYDMISASLEDTMSRGEGIGVSLAYWSRAVLCNSQGRHGDALAAAREASAYACDVGVANWGLIELVEAGVKAGADTIAGEAAERLTAKTTAGGTAWAQGIEAYAQALVNGGSRADELYRTAISALSRAGIRAQLARAHLSYGEWLAGDGRRGAAREQLQIAGDLFTAMGYQAFAERAGQELAAVGGGFRRTEQRDHQLTAQQWRIVRLAHQGLTNPEIGAELSVSPRTVEWHLRKIFGKLGITNRRELRAALAQHPPPDPPLAG